MDPAEVCVSTEVNSQPPTAWRYCGSQIKMWRTDAGIGREALAKEAGYDYEYVKSMENGRRRPTLRLLQVADQACGAGGKLVAAQEYLKPEPFPARSQEFMAIEAEAISFTLLRAAAHSRLVADGGVRTGADREQLPAARR